MSATVPSSATAPARTTTDTTTRAMSLSPGQSSHETGMIVDLGLLDRVLATEVRDRFDHRNINLDVPEFADGQLIPTGENLARVILGFVQAALGDRVRVTEVRVAEDTTLSATVRAVDG